MNLNIKELKSKPKIFYKYDEEMIAKLVKSAFNNEKEPTNFLFERLDDYYKYYVKRHLTIVHDTDDIIQDALIKVYKFIKKCQTPPEYFGKFATTILKNTYFAYCKKLNRKSKLAKLMPVDECLNIADKLIYQPEKIVEFKDKFSKFKAVVEKLPEKSRKLFTLSAIHRFSEKEIRKLTNVAPSTMHRYVAKAKLELIEQFPELKEAV